MIWTEFRRFWKFDHIQRVLIIFTELTSLQSHFLLIITMKTKRLSLQVTLLTRWRTVTHWRDWPDVITQVKFSCPHSQHPTMPMLLLEYSELWGDDVDWWKTNWILNSRIWLANVISLQREHFFMTLSLVTICGCCLSTLS